jgi:hypothetical protein
MKNFLIVLAFFVSSQLRADPRKEDFRLARAQKQGWELFWKDKKLGEIQTIGGGEPKILRLEKKPFTEKEAIFCLFYDAGTAGTRIQTQVERLVLLTEDKTQEMRWVEDHLYKLIRFQGERTLLEDVREIKLRDKQLFLSSFDEEDSVRYRFVEQKLLPMSN